MSSVESEAAALSAMECKQKGNAALSAKDFPTAILWYTEAIKKDPTQHVFYSNRSAAYLSKGDKELALADAEKCIELKPDWPKGYGRKGTALHRLGQFREAIKAYEDGLKVAPEDAALKRGLQDLKNAGPQTPNPFDANMWGKLAMHPTFKEWLNDPSYVSTLQTLQSNPALAQNPQLMQGDQRILQTYLFLLGIPFQMDGGGATGSATSTATNDNKRKANADENKKKEEEVVELTEEEKAAKEKLDRANAVKAEGNELYKAKK
eukprot:g2968.t1